MFGRAEGETCRHSLGLLSYIWTNYKTSGAMSLKTRPNWRCLVIIHRSNQTQHIGINASYKLSCTVVEGWWFGLVLQQKDLGTLHSNVELNTSSSHLYDSKSLAKIGSCDWTQVPQQICSLRQQNVTKSIISMSKDTWKENTKKVLHFATFTQTWLFDLFC